MRHSALLPLLVLLLCTLLPPGAAQAQLLTREVEPQAVIDNARRVLRDMSVHPDFEPLRL
jgi:hypothetical protein